MVPLPTQRSLNVRPEANPDIRVDGSVPPIPERRTRAQRVVARDARRAQPVRHHVRHQLRRAAGWRCARGFRAALRHPAPLRLVVGRTMDSVAQRGEIDKGHFMRKAMWESKGDCEMLNTVFISCGLIGQLRLITREYGLGQLT